MFSTPRISMAGALSGFGGTGGGLGGKINQARLCRAQCFSTPPTSQ